MPRTRISRGYLAWLVVPISAGVWGCGSAGDQFADSRRDAQALYHDALTSWEARQYPAAEKQFSDAIERRGLNFDLHCDAVIKRALCRAVAGQYEAAWIDIQQIEQHGGDLGKILAARSYILRQQGKIAESQSAWRQARQYDATIEQFKE